VQTAHRQGKRVCAHAHSVAAIRNCLDAGVDTLEHVTCITAEGPRLTDDLVAQMARAGAWLIPTIACYRNPVQAGLPKTFIKKIGMQGMDFVELHQRQTQRMLDGGARIAGGTDGVQIGVGPADIADEAAYLAEVAGSAQFGLRAVTSLAAAALGLEGDRGVIAAGQRADLLLLADNPLQDMRALRRVIQVFQDGRPVAAAGAPNS
jgi:imidazolonepropionase-like amidohydrolase